MSSEIQIEIASDVVCPWCYIGKRRLEKALAMLDGEVTTKIRWLPFQLNPGIPDSGLARAKYRKAKFRGRRAVSRLLRGSASAACQDGPVAPIRQR